MTAWARICLWRYDDNYKLSKHSALIAKGITKSGEELCSWERLCEFFLPLAHLFLWAFVYLFSCLKAENATMKSSSPPIFTKEGSCKTRELYKQCPGKEGKLIKC